MSVRKLFWAGVAKEPALTHLHDKVESAVVRAGLEPDRQNYRPHVTLAHPKDPPPHKLQQYLAMNNLFRSESFEVTHFTLFSSHIGSETPIYHAERSYDLSSNLMRYAAQR